MSGGLHIDFDQEADAILDQLTSRTGVSEDIRFFIYRHVKRWLKGDFQIDIMTSGSTGDPKLITLKPELLRWSVLSSTRALKIANEHSYVVIPADKTGGMMQIFRSFLNRWKVTVTVPSANPFLDPIPRGITNVSITPFQLSAILRDPTSLSRLKSVKTVLVGGGSISVSDRRLIREAGFTGLFHTYGMTETAGHVALADPLTEIFIPLDGVKVEADENRCARIRIPEVGIDLQTNDVIRLEKDGFSVLGRVDFIVNSGGLKLNPEELETRIQEAYGERLPEFFLYGLPDEELGQKLVLIATDQADLKQLTESISVLQGAEKPKEIIQVPKFIYTSTSKLDRRKTAAQIS